MNGSEEDKNENNVNYMIMYNPKFLHELPSYHLIDLSNMNHTEDSENQDSSSYKYFFLPFLNNVIVKNERA